MSIFICLCVMTLRTVQAEWQRKGRASVKSVLLLLHWSRESICYSMWFILNTLSSKSRLDTIDDKMDEKYEEYKEAIKTGEFPDEYNLTNNLMWR